MYRDLALTSLDTIRGYDITTGVHLFTLDELSNATIAQTQEKQDIVGKLGRKLSSFKKNKAVTVSATNGLVSGGLFELQTGSKFTTPENGVAVRVTEDLTAEGSSYAEATSYDAGTTYYAKTTDNGVDTYSVATGVTGSNYTSYYTLTTTKVTISNTATGTLGSEIDAIDIIDGNGKVVKHLDQANAVASGKFTYATATGVIEIGAADAPVGYTVSVHYDTIITGADVLENKSDAYSGKCRLYIDATAEDICGNTYHVQFHLPKADVNGEFSLEMGDNQTVHAFEAEALSGACGLGAVFFEYIVFGTTSDDD